MKPAPHASSLLVVLAAVAWTGPWAGCGNGVASGTKNKGGSPAGTGGVLGNGGVGAGGTHADAAVGTGGTGGGGIADAPIGTGGLAGTGGRVGTGGVLGSGGRPGTGGATAVAGSTGSVCGTIAGLSCSAGQFCDLDSRCGTIADAAGVCRPTGSAVGCIAAEIPVCGCDGKTYSNDCERMRVGMLKAHDGACSVDGGTTGSVCPYECRTDSSGVTGWYSGNTLVCAANCTACVVSCSAVGTGSEGCYASCPAGSFGGDCGTASTGLIRREACGGNYPTAYLAWEVPGGVAGTGPAIVVNASDGWVGTWDNVAGFLGSPTPVTPSNPTRIQSLTRGQTDNLFSRLASVNVSSLPHPMSIDFHEAYPALYFRLCQDCAATTLKYESAKQLAPEMDPVWLWFDQVLGADSLSNPRDWCNWDS